MFRRSLACLAIAIGFGLAVGCSGSSSSSKPSGPPGGNLKAIENGKPKGAPVDTFPLPK